MATRGPIGERPGLPKPKPPKAAPAPAPPAGVFFPGGLGHITIGAPLAPLNPARAPALPPRPVPVAPPPAPAKPAAPPSLGVLPRPPVTTSLNTLPPPKLTSGGTPMPGLNSTLAGQFGGLHTVTRLPGAPALPAPGTAAWNATAAGPSIPITAPVPPTLSLGGATTVLGAAAGGDPAAGAYVATTVASANSGHPLGVANAEVLTLAQRLSILSKFATQFVSPQAGQDLLTGLHLAR